jgi:hypothetical protein
MDAPTVTKKVVGVFVRFVRRFNQHSSYSVISSILAKYCTTFPVESSTGCPFVLVQKIASVFFYHELAHPSNISHLKRNVIFFKSSLFVYSLTTQQGFAPITSIESQSI